MIYHEGSSMCCICGGGNCLHVGPHIYCSKHDPERNVLSGKVALVGWTCPRCGKVWSPFQQACDCVPLVSDASRETWGGIAPANSRTAQE